MREMGKQINELIPLKLTNKFFYFRYGYPYIVNNLL